MNNNRGGNNRRRGRSNNGPRPQGAIGGGQSNQQVNRIDSRARGNAPQMLEKYRKLASDAHLNGDRVNAEYNLQFADHYFRVIADTRVRQEEQRLRRDDRWQENGDNGADESDDAGDFNAENEFPAFDQPPVYTRREREDRPEQTSGTGDRVSAERGQDRPQSPAAARPDYRRDDRPAAGHAAERQNRSPDTAARPVAKSDELAPTAQGWTSEANETPGTKSEPAESAAAYESSENPFLRDPRGGRGLRPRREDRRPRREDRPESATAGEINGSENDRDMVSGQLGETPDTDRSARAIAAGINPDILPPSFTVPRDEPAAANAAAPAPAPRRRGRPKKAADDAGEPIQSLI